VSFLAIEVVKGVVWQGGAARQWGVAVAAGGGWGRRGGATVGQGRDLEPEEEKEDIERRSLPGEHTPPIMRRIAQYGVEKKT
jgi:hypothetical protein